MCTTAIASFSQLPMCVEGCNSLSTTMSLPISRGGGEGGGEGR